MSISKWYLHEDIPQDLEEWWGSGSHYTSESRRMLSYKYIIYTYYWSNTSISQNFIMKSFL